MFEKEKFASILKKIAENYDTISDFAEEADIDRTYISKYLNEKAIKPPSARTLRKIANASKNICSYEELMNLCGYLDYDSNDYTGNYNRLENLVNVELNRLELENAQLKSDLDEISTQLAVANAKLEIYERLATITNSNVTLGFGPPKN